MATQTKPKPIQLSYHDESGRNVVITPEDKDLFVMSVQEAAVACQMAGKAFEFGKQIEEALLPKLASWLAHHNDQVKKAYLTIREGGLLFLVVKIDAHYDREFEDEFTTLDIDIAQDSSLNLIQLDVLTLPNVSDDVCESFLNPEFTVIFSRG